MTAPIALLNCCRFDESPGAQRTSVIVRDGLIDSIGSTDIIPEDAVIIDAEGRLLTPGFIDLHIHGAGGADVLHGTRAALETMSRTLARAGTTSFVATTAPRPNEGHRHLHIAAACTGTDLGGAELLGIYVEGPFVNMEKRGGLHPGGVYSPSIAALDELLAITDGALRLMTVAPELPGNLEVVERLLARGVIAAFGHSDATYRQALSGMQAGIRHVTHLFNAMRPIHHREPGPVLAVLESPGITAELVCDGVHVDPAIVGWAYRQLGRERCVCVTDGMRTLGMPDGRYEFAGMEGESRDGTARYLDGTLIGTTIPLAKMTGRFQRFCGIDAKTAIDAATIAPARVLGLEKRKGSLAAGMDADLVLLEKDWEPWLTMVGGAVVYERTADSTA